MTLHIGIDLGTSGCRVSAVDGGGNLIDSEQTPLPPSTQPFHNAHEQQPEDWWQALNGLLQSTLQRLPNEPIDSFVVDGTSSTLLLCDQNGSPLTPGVMYNDQRATEEADLIHQIAPSESGAHGPSASLAKLLWLLEHSSFSQPPRHALHQADWISNRLAGTFGHSDENNALKLGYDPRTRRWPAWISTLPLSASLLPAVHPIGTPYATLRPALMQRWDIEQNQPIQIRAGTTDSVAAAIAAGAQHPGDAITSLGSTLVLKIVSNTPIFSPEHGIYSHRLGDRWLVSGASNAGGSTLLQHFSLQEIEALTPLLNPDHSTGLNFYPLPSTGERFPIADPTLQPHLEPQPKERHLFLQAILEGLTRIEQMGYRKMVDLGAPPPTRVLTAGGGSNNPAWTKFREQALSIPVLQAQQPEASYGAALLSPHSH